MKKAVIVVDDFLHVHLSHSTFSPSALTSARADLRVSRYRHQHRNIQDRAPVTLLPTPSRTTPIVGHRSVFYQELSQYAVAYPMWSLSLSPGETIQRMIPAIRGPVASVGKVLGNRTTLYKYLNLRLFVAAAADSSAQTTVLVVAAGSFAMFAQFVVGTAGSWIVQGHVRMMSSRIMNRSRLPGPK